MIKSLIYIFIFLSTNELCCNGHNIRGLSTQRLSLYNPLNDFTCLDGSVTIPFSYINDDYCDCPDGTDEPGTAACPHGIFHCSNKGYIPKNIPSGFVNDGFCDCCDASDEYNNNNCSDTCEELGYEAKRLAEKISQMFAEGSRIRTQMIASAKKVLESKQLRVSELEVEKTEAVRLKDEAEAVKKEAESHESAALEEYKAKEDASRAQKAQEELSEELKEAQNYFNSFDNDHDGLLQITELKAHKIFDQNLDGDVADEELKFIEDATSEPVTIEVFKEIVWPRIKPIIIMNKIKAEQRLLDSSKESEQPDIDSSVPKGLENDLEYIEDRKPDEETEDEEEENDEDDEESEVKGFAEPAESNPKYDEKTAKLVEAANEARKQYETATQALQDLDREMTNLKNFLSKDYGEEDEFVPLDGQCFTYTDREYSYKLCPFDQVTQMGKSGGSETRLGTWGGWSEKNYSAMLYDKGQSCWNGPQRSTKVMVSCGLENEVISVAEPNKCEYVMEFKTPAACRLDEKHKDVHEEL